MSKKNAQENDRLEHLLRKWGADQAASQTKTASGLIPTRYYSRDFSLVRRWAPLAAAAALLVASTAVLYLSFAESSRGRLVAESTNGGKVAQLLERQKQLEVQLAQQRRIFEAEKAELVNETKTQIDALSQTIAEGQDRLEAALSLIGEKERELVDRKVELTEARKQLEGLSRQFETEAAKLRRANKAAVGAQRDLENELEAIRAQVASISMAFNSLYLATTVAEGRGFPKRQLLARQNRIIERGGELRKNVRSESTRMLFDTLEVLLTRLDLLDPQNTDEVASFAALLNSIDLVRRIDVILTSGVKNPSVRTWLIETRLILGEVKSVG